VAEAREKLYGNLRPVMGDPHGWVVERIAAVAERAGNSSEGHPPRPRADDPIGTSRYAVDFLNMLAGVLAEQEKRISELEGKK
jgi:hypothetical protein